ncbi:MAG: YigZ family protein [Clostridiales bacterium]|nr:YigZ family protein [Clostridiales bacterium]
MDAYRTIRGPAIAEFTERRSRFIGAAAPAADEEEALAFITRVKKERWDARHNVSAFILDGGRLRRYSDDGEPQGTAGQPVLDVLAKEQLTGCALVVTRYFGGILLGAGGLVRAYSHAAKIAVDAAGTVWMQPCDQLELTCGYSLYGRLPALIAELDGEVDDTVFAEGVTLRFHLPAERTAAFQTRLNDLSAGSLTAERIGAACYPQEK